MPLHGVDAIPRRRAAARTAGYLAALSLVVAACVTGQREPPPLMFWCPDGGWDNGGLHCLTTKDSCQRIVDGSRLILQWQNQCVATDTAWCVEVAVIPDMSTLVGMQCYLTREVCDFLFDIRGLDSECFPFREVRVYQARGRRY